MIRTVHRVFLLLAVVAAAALLVLPATAKTNKTTVTVKATNSLKFIVPDQDGRRPALSSSRSRTRLDPARLQDRRQEDPAHRWGQVGGADGGAQEGQEVPVPAPSPPPRRA
jgi:hypothetical protein